MYLAPANLKTWLGCLQLASGKAVEAYINTCKAMRSYWMKWLALADKNPRKTFADSATSHFPERTAEVECQLFKAAVGISGGSRGGSFCDCPPNVCGA